MKEIGATIKRHSINGPKSFILTIESILGKPKANFSISSEACKTSYKKTWTFYNQSKSKKQTKTHTLFVSS